MTLLLVTAAAWADQDVAKKPEKLQDQVWVVLHPGAEKNQAVAVLSAANVNPGRVLSFPLKYVAGEESIQFDSISYVGTRVEHFTTKAHTLFPKRDALLMIMMAPYTAETGITNLEPGTGEIARIYFSSKGNFPLDSFRIGPVKLPPDNKLMFVTDTFTGVEPTFEFRLEKAAAKKLVKDE
jgi:hypothetical protein